MPPGRCARDQRFERGRGSSCWCGLCGEGRSRMDCVYGRRLARAFQLAVHTTRSCTGRCRCGDRDGAARVHRAHQRTNNGLDSTHGCGQATGNIYGANLGFRSDVYTQVGGFRPLSEHEDVDLVERMRLVAQVIATDRNEVITSGRSVGHTVGGYARDLRKDLLGAALLLDVP